MSPYEITYRHVYFMYICHESIKEYYYSHITPNKVEFAGDTQNTCDMIMELHYGLKHGTSGKLFIRLRLVYSTYETKLFEIIISS